MEFDKLTKDERTVLGALVVMLLILMYILINVVNKMDNDYQTKSEMEGKLKYYTTIGEVYYK